MNDALESREEKFVRLAEKRVVKAVHAIGLIGNLGAYPHKAGHTAKIMEYLKTAVESVEYRLGGEKAEKKSGFKLED